MTNVNMVQKKRFEMKWQLYCHALFKMHIYICESSILNGATIEFEYINVALDTKV